LAVGSWGGDTLAMRTAHRSRPSTPPGSVFAGFRFPSDGIAVAVRWSLRFGLSYRDVEELPTERGIQVDHVTMYRWVLRFTPLLADAARPCRHRMGDRWQRYRCRNQIERGFNRRKQLRAVATRYDKLRCRYEATLMVASILDWLRARPDRPTNTAPDG
jgi:transposase